HLFPSPDGTLFTAQSNKGDPAFDMGSDGRILHQMIAALDGDTGVGDEALLTAFLLPYPEYTRELAAKRLKQSKVAADLAAAKEEAKRQSYTALLAQAKTAVTTMED